MLELLGWIGLLLLIVSLAPFLLRRLHLWPQGDTWSRIHPRLTFTCLAVLTLHGVLALNILRGRGAHFHFQAQINTGILAWLVLITICLIAFAAYKRKTVSRTHCWMAGLLVLALFLHL